MLEELTLSLQSGAHLEDAQVDGAVHALVDDSVLVDAKADFLVALAQKGETIEEITGFARRLRDRATTPPLDAATRAGEILDVCGTGGDGAGTFNISTTVGIVAASAGIRVAKHGNRAITSKSGSADVLGLLGIPVDLSPQEAADRLRDLGFAFFFAIHYHPAFKHIGPARKRCAERGSRTIFNFLGPLLNPARPTSQLLGVARPELCEPIGKALQELGVRRGMVVCGSVGEKNLDELSPIGPNRLAEFYHDRGFSSGELNPQDYGAAPGRLEDLQGGSPEENAALIEDLLKGEVRGSKRDAVLLNTAAALLVADRVASLTEGWDRAAELIDSGVAYQKLKELRSS